MMTFLKKICQSLALKCFGALALGIVAVTLITLELAQIGLEEEMQTELSEADILRFPENEESLKLMSARLMDDIHAHDIEPAAGE